MNEAALELVRLLARMEVRDYGEDAEIDALHTMNRLICEARTIVATPPSVQTHPWAALLHPECVSPVPTGYDTVLGFLAKHHPDILECFDYTDPATTQRDGWWLSHRYPARCYVPAPPVLQEQGIEHVRVYPVDLLQKRWG